MATRQDIILPSGERKPIFYNKTQSKREIVENYLLTVWERYCLDHWMGGDGMPGSPEQRIKRFLDGCAYLLLRDDPGDTLTHYKEMMYGRTEIDVSSCPSWVNDKLYAGGSTLKDGKHDAENDESQCLLERLDQRVVKHLQRDKEEKKTRHKRTDVKQNTKFQRLEHERKQFPCAEFIICKVDTDNRFSLQDSIYHIADNVQGYLPKETREGLIYDMDRIYAVMQEGIPIRFLDQNANEIDKHDVRKE